MVRFLPSALAIIVCLAFASTAKAQEPDWEAIGAVQQALKQNMSAGSILAMLEERGYSLEEATHLAVGATVGEDQLDFIREGVCGASDVSQARSVAAAASEVAEEDAADNIRELVQRYASGGCDEGKPEKPSSYLPSGTDSSGGGIDGGPSSPSS